MNNTIVKLDAAEDAQLARLENRISQGLASFIEVGEALSAIRERRLYRASHGTFEEYCREKWGMSRVRAHQFIDGAEAVLTIVNKEAIKTESQARELAKVEPAQRAAVVEKAAQATGGKITASAIREASKPITIEMAPAEKPAEAPANIPLTKISTAEMSEASDLWLVAKGRLDNIRRNDPQRVAVLREVIAYAQQRIDRNK